MGDIYMRADEQYHQPVSYSSHLSNGDVADSRVSATTGLWLSIFNDMAGIPGARPPTFSDGIAARYWCDVLTATLVAPNLKAET